MKSRKKPFEVVPLTEVPAKTFASGMAMLPGAKAQRPLVRKRHSLREHPVTETIPGTKEDEGR